MNQPLGGIATALAASDGGLYSYADWKMLNEAFCRAAKGWHTMGHYNLDRP
jgi:hypothetical protein